MQLQTLLLAGLVLATGSAADRILTSTNCPFVGPCNSDGEFVSAFGTYRIDANEGCRSPDVPGMIDLCMDWGNGRMHFHFENQPKRCMRREENDFDVQPCGDGTSRCSKLWWNEAACNW